VTSWSFLTSHARVLLCIAHDPGVRLCDIAASLDITERSTYGIVTDLAAAGYVVKQKDGRRNRYQIQAHLPLPEPISREPAIGDVLALLAGAGARPQLTRTGPQAQAGKYGPHQAMSAVAPSGRGRKARASRSAPAGASRRALPSSTKARPEDFDASLDYGRPEPIPARWLLAPDGRSTAGGWVSPLPHMLDMEVIAAAST
jgi:hypothetical protein